MSKLSGALFPLLVSLPKHDAKYLPQTVLEKTKQNVDFRQHVSIAEKRTVQSVVVHSAVSTAK